MSDQSNKSYRVLARKYRPATFAELIGQEAMVRTLGNAFEMGRIAHAFILTGVRGVGKTTTARIIARALNCVGPDGQGGATVSPCGECEPCRAIAEDRHVDVIEMDAASHTGVDDIRELIDGARYVPASARYKVYIIDEVHMLSKNAFNALLKTLEEPPPHVKFIFATTEIRKVPVTVLSRCQRFDLRRIDASVLIEHLGRIAGMENASVAPEALALIARAAEGSARDALSLLDQAISFAADEVSEDQVRDMLGLADRAVVIDLFESLMAGKPAQALDLMGNLYEYGADPVIVVKDLLEFTHWLTRLKITENAAEDIAASEAERVRGKDLAARLPMSELSRTWQLLLKGLGEVMTAALPLAAAEMVLIRIAYAADLPTPAELIGEIKAGGPGPGAAPGAQAGASAQAAPGTQAGPGAEPQSSQTPSPPPQSSPPSSPAAATVMPAGSAQPARTLPAEDMEAAPAPAPEPVSAAPPESAVTLIQSFRAAVELAAERREMTLYAHLIKDVHLVHFEAGRIEIRLGKGAPRRLPNQLGEFLTEAAETRWVVSVSDSEGEPTLQAQAEARADGLRQEAAAHPLDREIFETVPGAKIRAVRDLGPGHAADAGEESPDGEETPLRENGGPDE